MAEGLQTKQHKVCPVYVKQNLFFCLINLWFSMKNVCLTEHDNFNIECILLLDYLRSTKEVMKIIWFACNKFYFHYLKQFQKNIAIIILVLIKLLIQRIWVNISKKSPRPSYVLLAQ